MKKNLYFMVGPTEIPDRVLHSMNKQIISHRSEEYYEIQDNLTKNLKKIFKTKKDVLTLTCSGTGAMESVIHNCFSPGDEVVVPVIGEFSERYAIIAKKLGLAVKTIKFDLGENAKFYKVMEEVSDNTKGVLVVHNESATGVFNDLKEFGKALKDTEALLICDSVSGLGGLEIKMDEWNVDVVFTSSQKALMSPPGLGFVALSDKAWDVVKKTKSSSFYFDFEEALKFNRLKQTPWTPAISLVIGANEATNMIMEEGIDNVYKRHKLNSKMVIKGIKNLGLSMFPKDEKYASPTVNTINAPNISRDIVSKLKEKNIIVSGGQGHLGHDTFRIGTMGYVTEKDVAALLYMIKKILIKL